MNPDELQLLRDHVDGTLPDHRRADVERLLARPEARRFVDEHRLVWDALGDALAQEPEDESAAFRAETVRRAHADESRDAFRSRRFAAALAAALLLAVGLLAVLRPPAAPSSTLSPTDHDVVRHLHLLRDLPLVERWSRELDLRSRLDVLAAFAGELEPDEG